VLLFIAAVWALLFRQRSIALTLPLMVLASLPAVQVGHRVAARAPRAGDAGGRYDQIIGNALLVWAIVVLVRCAALSLDARAARDGWARSSGKRGAAVDCRSSSRPRWRRTIPWFVKAPSPGRGRVDLDGVDAARSRCSPRSRFYSTSC